MRLRAVIAAAAAAALLVGTQSVHALQARFNPLKPQGFGDPAFPDCSADAPMGSFPICNPSLDWRTRVVDLVGRMTVAEKIGWLGDTSPAIPRLGMPAYEWWSEALHGIAGNGGAVNWTAGPISCATSFPEPLGIATAFDRKLIQDVASVISTEARAMNNVGQAGMTYFTPHIGLFRDPRWGRGQETPGEDPYMGQQYAYAFVQGLQGGEDDRYLKVIADCKHLVAYDLDNWGGVTRESYNAIVADQDMYESYMPAFETCIRDARAASVMCSYNAVNGVPSCANAPLLKIARENWGLEGFIVSDDDSVATILSPHNYTTTNDSTIQVAMNAGCDLNVGDFYQTFTQGALDDGVITESQIDNALINSIGTMIRTGYFDPADSQPYRQITPDQVNTPAAQALALKAALEGLVLIKNDPAPSGEGNTLPLSAEGNPTLALIGPLGNATLVLQGNYYGQPPFLVSPIQGLTDAGFNVVYVAGCDLDGNSTEGFNDAIAAAKKAKYVVFMGGIDYTLEAEALDRYSIDLPLIQQQLIAALGEALDGAGIPMVAAFFGGGPTDYSVALNTPQVGAVLWMGYPGQSGGTAIASILSGVVSPAGRLATTIYPADYVNQVSMFDMSFRVSETNPGRTYRFYPGDKAVVEFGTGLSYTTFDFQWINEADYEPADFDVEGEQSLTFQSVDISELVAAHENSHLTPALSYRVNVSNTGSVESDVVVLLFLLPENPDPTLAPIKQLVGFERVFGLAPGQEAQVFFPLQARQLAQVNAKGERWLHPGRVLLGIDQPTKKMHVLELTGLARRLH